MCYLSQWGIDIGMKNKYIQNVYSKLFHFFISVCKDGKNKLVWIKSVVVKADHSSHSLTEHRGAIPDSNQHTQWP